MRKNGYTWFEISKKLNRTKDAVRVKYKSVVSKEDNKDNYFSDHKTKKIIDKKGRELTFWTKEMVVDLVQMKSSGFSWREIAKKLKVTPKAAEHKYRYLLRADAKSLFIQNETEKKNLENLIDSYRYVVKKLIGKGNEYLESILAAENYFLRTQNKEGFFELIKTIKNSS